MSQVKLIELFQPADETMNHHDAVRVGARRFRDAIVSTDKTKLPSTFENFPVGCCGDTAPMLGHYLCDIGLGKFDYVLGERGSPGPASDEQSHAWLQQEGLVVDITADQFPEIQTEVIVSADSQWHRTFRSRTDYVADFELEAFQGPAHPTLRDAYVQILARLR